MMLHFRTVQKAKDRVQLSYTQSKQHKNRTRLCLHPLNRTAKIGVQGGKAHQFVRGAANSHLSL